jgi:hypothetical protein
MSTPARRDREFRMAAIQLRREVPIANPLDLMEQIAAAQDWLFDRANDRELALEVQGAWCDYRCFVTWCHDARALLFACSYEMRVPANKRPDVATLLSVINEKMLVGHFDLWAEDGVPAFRHAVLLRGMPGASVEQLEDLMDIALTECERYYPAFQFVVWGGKSPAEAVQAAMLETVGEA